MITIKTFFVFFSIWIMVNIAVTTGPIPLKQKLAQCSTVSFRAPKPTSFSHEGVQKW